MGKKSVSGNAGSRSLRFTNEDFWGYLFIGGAMVIFCVFTLYPVLSAIYTSFLEYKPFGSVDGADQSIGTNLPGCRKAALRKNSRIFCLIDTPAE